MLDPTIGIGSTRIMTLSSQRNSTSGFIFSNDTRRSGCREDRALTDNEFGNTVGCGEPEDVLDGGYGVAAPIAADYEG